ncbi:hypothetical protein HFO55_34800 [Rhizobium leguminosarum]|uniref:hypothetical protein n=1 Tax=Rhizobium leguminosarum TaxID=384 RepID=UPI001C97979C|nr:hypothetical protein [Rhizobium leguminosarum]MBY5572267.1 hypothetical protein [Rhizobium leguminosarum]
MIVVAHSPYMAKVSFALKLSLISPAPVGGKAISGRATAVAGRCRSVGALRQFSLDSSRREESQICHRYDYRDDDDSQHEFDHAFGGFLLCVVHADKT